MLVNHKMVIHTFVLHRRNTFFDELDDFDNLGGVGNVNATPGDYE